MGQSCSGSSDRPPRAPGRACPSTPRQPVELQDLVDLNVTLRSSLDGVKQKMDKLEQQLEQLQGKKEVPTEVSSRGSSTAERSPCTFVGRACTSLSSIIANTSEYMTLPLICDQDVSGAETAALVVKIYPMEVEGQGERPQSPGDFLGRRVDFVVHVIEAKGLPKEFSDKVFCKYVFRWAERGSYQTPLVRRSTDPFFDFKKRFAFEKMSPRLLEYFHKDNVLTFEVIGCRALYAPPQPASS